MSLGRASYSIISEKPSTPKPAVLTEMQENQKQPSQDDVKNTQQNKLTSLAKSPRKGHTVPSGSPRKMQPEKNEHVLVSTEVSDLTPQPVEKTQANSSFSPKGKDAESDKEIASELKALNQIAEMTGYIAAQKRKAEKNLDRPAKRARLEVQDYINEESEDVGEDQAPTLLAPRLPVIPFNLPIQPIARVAVPQRVPLNLAQYGFFQNPQAQDHRPVFCIYGEEGNQASPEGCDSVFLPKKLF